jgi:hypothetical protein
LQATNCPEKNQLENGFKLQGVQGTPNEEYKKFSMVVGSCSTISILLGQEPDDNNCKSDTELTDDIIKQIRVET